MVDIAELQAELNLAYAAIVHLGNAVDYAHSERFEWPVDPWAAVDAGVAERAYQSGQPALPNEPQGEPPPGEHGWDEFLRHAGDAYHAEEAARKAIKGEE